MSATAMGALAYTVGSDVVFQRHAYDAQSTAGRTTLAHELTHVLQQRAGPVDGSAIAHGVSVSDPGDRFEREAVATAAAVVGPARAAAVEPSPAPGPAAQRLVAGPGTLLLLQRTAGNRAVHRLLHPADGVGVQRLAAASSLVVQRHGSPGPFQPQPGSALDASPVLARQALDGGVPDGAGPIAGVTGSGGGGGGGGAATATPPRGIAGAIADRDIDALKATQDWSAATDGQRVEAAEVLLDQWWVGPYDEAALEQIWRSFGAREGVAQQANVDTWRRCVDRGAELRQHTRTDVERVRAGTRPDVMTPMQAGRVEAAMQALTTDDHLLLRAALERASSNMVRWFLYKAIAAGRSVADVQAFLPQIDGQDDTWLLSHLGLVQEDVAAGTQAQTGIRQQWQMACGATTVQIIHGETDPIYALTLQQAGNVNPQDQSNAATTAGQQSIMGASGVVATPVGTAGQGLWVEGQLNALSSKTGVTYAYTAVAGTASPNPASGAMDMAVTEIIGHVTSGVHVPLLIGGGPGVTAHYVTAVRAQGNSLLVHDPGNGTTAWVTRAAFLANTLAPPLAWPYLAGFDRPTKVTP